MINYNRKNTLHESNTRVYNNYAFLPLRNLNFYLVFSENAHEAAV